MIERRSAIRMIAVVLVLVTGLAASAHALATDTANSGVPMPVIPMGMGDACVEDTDFMRRNHMDMLKHQRDETVLRGVRTRQYSLVECINCHVVNAPDSEAVSASDPRHFCRACHDYAAVSIDCFQCHASRPGSGDSTAEHSTGFTSPGAIGINKGR
jgi:hypothetical protein